MTRRGADTGFRTRYPSPGADSGWIAVGTSPAFAANWGNFGAPFQVVRFRKIGGLLYLNGLALRSTSTSGANSTIFILPAGFRPANAVLMASLSGADVIARINVQSTGEVTVQQTITAGSYVNLTVAPVPLD